MNFADRTPEEESTRILDRAIEASVNFIDTANFYGQVLNEGAGMGHTEERLGRYFASRRQFRMAGVSNCGRRIP